MVRRGSIDCNKHPELIISFQQKGSDASATINAEPLKVDLLGGLRVTVNQQQRLSLSVLPRVDLDIPHHTASDVNIMVFKVGKGGGTGHCVYTTWRWTPFGKDGVGISGKHLEPAYTSHPSSRSHRDMGCCLLSLMWRC